MTNSKKYLGYLSAAVVVPPPSDEGIGGVSANLLGFVDNIDSIIDAILLVTSVGLLVGALLRYRAHRRNPIEVTLGSVITMIILAVILFILTLIPIQFNS